MKFPTKYQTNWGHHAPPTGTFFLPGFAACPVLWKKPLAYFSGKSGAAGDCICKVHGVTYCHHLVDYLARSTGIMSDRRVIHRTGSANSILPRHNKNWAFQARAALDLEAHFCAPVHHSSGKAITKGHKKVLSLFFYHYWFFYLHLTVYIG
jgi:hypothetical protein